MLYTFFSLFSVLMESEFDKSNLFLFLSLLNSYLSALRFAGVLPSPVSNGADKAAKTKKEKDRQVENGHEEEIKTKLIRLTAEQVCNGLAVEIRIIKKIEFEEKKYR